MTKGKFDVGLAAKRALSRRDPSWGRKRASSSTIFAAIMTLYRAALGAPDGFTSREPWRGPRCWPEHSTRNSGVFTILPGKKEARLHYRASEVYAWN